jgi:NADH-quinone oxidoreductase subunit L
MFENFQFPPDLAWVILLLPLLSAVVITLGTRRDGELSANISIAAVVLSFLLSVGLFFILQETVDLTKGADSRAFSWLNIADFKVDIGLHLDRLSLLMLLVVTGVGGVIHIYSRGYMHGDPGKGRYFASLSLFMFSMLGIVLANNLVMMFIFWELVGVSSYLLIGFWFERPSAADAAKKAFITNRLGDCGFILGILLVWGTLGSVSFDELALRLAKNPAAWASVGALACFLIFCGAMGKSAQFPLHVWLPDAMEGPTPVSALIHAATMVAAGVYMLCRVFFLFGAENTWPGIFSFLNGWTAAQLIAAIGGLTALLAALMAVQQDDIKRILAYSTLSQLGYMVMAVGVLKPTAAMYHLTTHAFFKALLFLGAGSVIHACHHEQNIWKMGGLKDRLPITYKTFLIGTLALCGVPGFSGFYSKDAVLAAALDHSALLFVVGVLVAFLTTFYMSRLFLVAFLGRPRSEAAGHASESPKVMTWPLILLAIPSVLAGVWGLDTFLASHWTADLAAAGVGVGVGAGHGDGAESFLDALFAPFSHAPGPALASVGAIVFGFTFACTFYGRAAADPLPAKLGLLARVMRDRFYFDEIYQFLIRHTHEALAKWAERFDRWIIAGAGVRGLAGGTDILGRGLRLLQSGNVQTYAFLTIAGLVVVLLLALR